MHEFRVWVLAALVLLGTTETEAAAKKIAPAKKPPAPVEYDFRGARLGMSLQDFRNLPFPDLDKRSARAICTSDSESVGHGVVLFANDYEKAAGVVKCGYFSTDTFLKDWSQSAQVSVGTTGYATIDLSYSFVPDPTDGVLKLYSIDLTTNNNAAQSALEGITEKFGPATLRTNDTVQNRMGASFAHTTVSWVNPLSIILVESPSFQIDQMTILYSEIRLADIVTKMKEKIRGPASSKM